MKQVMIVIALFRPDEERPCSRMVLAAGGVVFSAALAVGSLLTSGEALVDALFGGADALSSGEIVFALVAAALLSMFGAITALGVTRPRVASVPVGATIEPELVVVGEAA